VHRFIATPYARSKSSVSSTLEVRRDTLLVIMPRNRRNNRGPDRNGPPAQPVQRTGGGFVPIIPIVSTLDMTKTKMKTWKVDVQVAGLKSEESVPMYGGSTNREEFLHFLHSFTEFSESFGFAQDGDGLFAAFRSQH